MSRTTYRKLKSSNKLLIPIILMMGFVPLIVHMYEYSSGLAQFDWFPESLDTQIDFFFAGKMIAIVLLGAVMLGILLYRCLGKKEKLQFETSFYLLAFYGLFVVMSALFSQYKHWVSAGTYELFESVWVVLAYLIVCYYTYHYVQEEKQVYTLLGWAGIGMFLVTIIGVFQTFGMDFFKTRIGKLLILNPDSWGMMDKLTFNMAEGTAYTTLYNPNFLSFYYGMLIPLITCLFLAVKKLSYKVILVIAEILAVICLIGSKSDSGWLALVCGAGVVILVLCSRSKKALVAFGSAMVIGIAAVALVCVSTPFGQRLLTTVAGSYRLEEKYALRDIRMDTDGVVLDINGNELKISCYYDELQEEMIVCMDSEGNILPTTCIDEANKVNQIEDSRYNGNLILVTDEQAGQHYEMSDYGTGAPCNVRPSAYGNGFCVTLDVVSWDFLKMDDGSYYYVNPAGKLVTYEKIATSRLFRDDAMSFRGRIWNNTIPLLGQCIFVGTGANTYLFATPQNDYIYKACIGALGTFDVKAHCWYLQQWVENGLIAMLLVAGFCLWYVVRCVRIYRKADLKQSFTWVGVGLFAAVVVYLIAAAANDSNVCTAPLFWGMLGLGMAVNRLVVSQQNLFVLEEEPTEAPKVVTAGTVKEQTNGNAPQSANGKKKQSGKKLSKKQRKNQKK